MRSGDFFVALTWIHLNQRDQFALNFFICFYIFLKSEPIEVKWLLEG